MAKKDFSAAQNPVFNPALKFITQTAPHGIPTESIPKAPAKNSKPTTFEKKSKRLNLLIQPSVLSDLSKIATMRRTSVNDLICGVLRGFTADESDTPQHYDETFGGE